MVPGRCVLYTTFRYLSELPKPHSNRKTSALTPELLLSTSSRKLLIRPRVAVERMASTSSSDSGNLAKQQNRLALEKSPYLLQHASNPVKWYPWGEEALEKAKREDKLIFLSVGYSTCHWCHVMEHESFENHEIANIMNEHFVNIKVDREERPDVDRIYMSFVQTISGHGGWPMSVFLMPDLTPITGGTYFPPEDKYGQPGFKSVLLSVAYKWSQDKEDILLVGQSIIKALKQSAAREWLPGKKVVPVETSKHCMQQIVRSYDADFGGFTGAPKFPQPVNFNFLFHMYARDPKSEGGKMCLNMCLHTLTKMAKGGIHDHVGQGFARYSVDGKWHVPHFEKMLYDQGQLLRSYADAYVATKDKFYSIIVDDIVTYVTRELRHKEGGFYSGEDADSLPDLRAKHKTEGAFYVWTYEEIEDLLSKTLDDSNNLRLCDVFNYHFNVKPEGNVKKSQDPHGELTKKNVLINFGSIEETAEHFKLKADEIEALLKEALEILFAERSKRPRPHLDDKIVTAWNGLMISGLSFAGAALNSSKYIEYATRAAEFVEKHLFDAEQKILLRSCYRDKDDSITQTSVPIHGFHVDYAYLVQGLLDLYEATFNTHWLEFAETLQDIQDNLFWDAKDGAYFATIKDDPTIILRLKDDFDGAEPSSNAVACNNLLRLASYMNREEFQVKATSLLSYFHEPLSRNSVTSHMPQLVSALMHYHDSTTQIYIAGTKDSSDTKELLQVIRERLLPSSILILADHKFQDNVLFRRSEVIAKMKPLNGRATAYVCHHHTCSLPVTEPNRFADLLDEK